MFKLPPNSHIIWAIILFIIVLSSAMIPQMVHAKDFSWDDIIRGAETTIVVLTLFGIYNATRNRPK